MKRFVCVKQQRVVLLAANQKKMIHFSTGADKKCGLSNNYLCTQPPKKEIQILTQRLETTHIFNKAQRSPIKLTSIPE
jgi:hypothetical protein